MWETEFDISILENPKVIVSCPDETLVGSLMNLLAENGVVWRGGEVPSKRNARWQDYKEETCYWIENGRMAYGNLSLIEIHSGDYANHIKCTFLGIDTPDFDVASDDELQALLGIGGGQ